jgi:hypothetical protein
MNVMTHPSGYRIGAATVTTDGEPGTVCALVVDPDTRKVTHLAVEPRHGHHRAKLVPTEIATVEPAGDVQIACDRDGFVHLDDLEQLDIIDAGPYAPYGGYGLYGPYGYDGLSAVGGGSHQVAVWTDRPPGGEAALRHGTPVRTDDHTVGHLDGLLTAADGRVTAILVASGHPWSRRTIAVPVDAVTRLDADWLTIAGNWDQVRRRS